MANWWENASPSTPAGPQGSLAPAPPQGQLGPAGPPPGGALELLSKMPGILQPRPMQPMPPPQMLPPAPQPSIPYGPDAIARPIPQAPGPTLLPMPGGGLQAPGASPFQMPSYAPYQPKDGDVDNWGNRYTMGPNGMMMGTLRGGAGPQWGPPGPGLGGGIPPQLLDVLSLFMSGLQPGLGALGQQPQGSLQTAPPLALR